MSASLKFVRRRRSHPEQGYILLTLMFLATLVILSLAALAPQMSQQAKRDQEEELIHRGVQYSRAIQHFYKKTGRYPVRMEELDNFNNMRFLRKHYKDPITGKDFRLLHFGEVQTMFSNGAFPNAGGLPGAGGIPGAAAANQPGAFGAANGQSAFNNQGFGNQGFNNQGFGNKGSDSQGFGNQVAMNQGSAGQDPNNPDSNNQSGNPNQRVKSGDQSSTDDSFSGNPGQPVSPFGGINNEANGKVFGGGPIVGVASTSPKKSIREFNKKNHYKDWQFIYDPGSDRGGLLNTPAQPNLNAGRVNSVQGNDVPAGPGQGQGFPPQGQQQPNNFGQQGMPLPNQPPDQMQPQ